MRGGTSQAGIRFQAACTTTPQLRTVGGTKRGRGRYSGMSILILILVVLVLLGLALYVVRMLPIPSPVNWIIQVILVVIAIYVIANRAGVI